MTATYVDKQCISETVYHQKSDQQNDILGNIPMYY